MHIYPLLSLFHLLFTVQGSWKAGPGAGNYSCPFLVQTKGDFWVWEEAPGVYALLRLPQAQEAYRGQVHLRIASTHSLPHGCFLDYKKDPYSKGDPCNTICCREDLNPLSPSPGGCYDTKVTCYWLLNSIFTGTLAQSKVKKWRFLWHEAQSCLKSIPFSIQLFQILVVGPSA